MIKYKKGGFTLIESIIYIGILLFIASFSITGILKLNSSLTNNVSVDYYNNYILSIFSNSTKYCKEKNKGGYLLFEDNGTIKFFCNNVKVETFDIPKGFKFLNTETFNKTIEINNLGILTKACTIKYMDLKGEINSITIRVGTEYVQIKEK